jgi:hypothetical protein
MQTVYTAFIVKTGAKISIKSISSNVFERKIKVV